MDVKWKLLLILIHFNLVNSSLPSLELLENRQTNRLHCLLRNETDTTSTAIVWETSRLDDLEMSQYKPNLFHCAMGRDRSCTNKVLNDFWKLDNSSNYNFDIVLDRRWENFDIIKTTEINYNHVDLPEISPESEIHISLKTKINGFVYLCDGMFPPKSNCYWITLAGWEYKNSIIRKCDRRTIPQFQGVYPKGKCMLKKDSYHSAYYDRKSIINDWSTYVITINDFVINIQNNNSSIISYKDPEQDISINYVFIASLTNSPAQWKINYQSTIYRTGEPKLIHKFERKNDCNKQILTFNFSIKEIVPINNLFVQICEKDNVFDGLCYKVIFNDNGRNTICKIFEAGSSIRCITSTRIFWPSFGKPTTWYHFKFINEKDIFTFLREDEEKVAEFIDENFTANYVFIGSEKMVLWKIHAYNVVTTKKTNEIKFPLNEINKNENVCLAIFVQKTPEANLSLSLNKNETFAYVNYTVEEDNVWEEVHLKTKILDKVNVYLNISVLTDGNEVFISDMRDCNENDRILELNTTEMMLKELPICVAVRYPIINVRPRKGLVKKGTIIVKSSEEVDLVWVPNIKDKSYVLKYSLIKYIGCNEKINEDNITIIPITPSNFGTLLYTTLSGLSPYVTYNFTILNENERIMVKDTIDMLTKETVEEDDLPTIQTLQDNINLEVSLSLHDCKRLRGPLYYTLTLEGVDAWNEDYEFERIVKRFYFGTSRHYYKILGYSTYRVSLLFSRNEDFLRGLLRHDLFISTNPTETVEEDDLPTIQTLQDNINLEVSLSLHDCKRLRGPLYYTLTLEGVDAWNEDYEFERIVKRFYFGTSRHYYKILGYSTYRVSLLFSRNEDFFKGLLRHDLFISTNPTAPFPVPNITMHSKTNSSISLRWQNPYPPTGKLENYFIQYWITAQQYHEIKVEVDSNCVLWPEFICGEIKNLTANTNYTICVVGKNVNSTKLSDCTTPLYVITKEDRPDPPRNVKVLIDDLVMIVNFERPDKSYGPLTSSIVAIEDKRFTFSIKKEDVNFFSVAINVEEFSARKLIVGLQVTNLGGVSESVYTTVDIPPKTPTIKSSGTFQIVNKNIVVVDSIFLENLDGFSEIFVYVPKSPYDAVNYNCKVLNDPEIYLHAKANTRKENGLGKVNKTDQKLNVYLKDRLIYGQYLKALIVIVRNSFAGEERCGSYKFFLKWDQSTHVWFTILILVIFTLITTAVAFVVYRCCYNDSEKIFGNFSMSNLCRLIKNNEDILD